MIHYTLYIHKIFLKIKNLFKSNNNNKIYLKIIIKKYRLNLDKIS